MPANLKLESYSDREVLHMIDDLADNEGWVDIAHLGSKIGISQDGRSDAAHEKYVRHCVGTRLGWIRRLSQTVERHPKESGRWRLTHVGEAVVKARLTQEIASKLENVSEFATLSAISTLSRRYIGANASSANLMRREWQYGTHRSRR